MAHKHQVVSFVRGYHAYMDIWLPSIDDELCLKRELSNKEGANAVANPNPNPTEKHFGDVGILGKHEDNNESLNGTTESKNLKIRHYGGSESNDFRIACGVTKKNEGHHAVAT